MFKVSLGEVSERSRLNGTHILHGVMSDIADGFQLTALFKSFCHFAAPDPEPEGHEESSYENENAHQNAHQHVNKSGEEAGIPPTTEKLDKPPELDEGDDKHNDGHEYREIAISLRSPVHSEK